MKAKWGALMVDGRGKVGGHVASKNRGGSYMRTKVTPSNPNTSAQANVRNRLIALSQGFRNLTANQIAAWNAAVSDYSGTNIFGDKVTPSGINLFTKLNSNLMEIGVAQITTPPLPKSVEPVEGIVVSSSAAVPSLSLAYTPDPVPADTAFIVRATAQTSKGVSNLSGKYRNIALLDAADASPFNALVAYNDKFGSLVAGRKIGFEMIPVNKITGQKGLAVSVTAIVGA